MARRSPVRVVFLALWLVFWGGGMLVAAWMLVGLAREGNPAAALLLLWLGAAAFALRRVGVRLAEELSGERLTPRRTGPHRAHQWNDDLPRGDGS